MRNRPSKPACVALLLCSGAMALAMLALRAGDHGIYAAIDHIWSDWPLHIAMARQFADAPPALWLANHPMIAGRPLHYPFAINLVSGMLMRAGLPLVPAMLVPSVLAIGAAFALLFLWLRRLAVPGPWAVTGLLLVMLSGGAGVLGYMAESLQSGRLHLPRHAYSRLDDIGWYSSNILAGLWLPQRAFAPGVAIALLGLCAVLPQLAAFGTQPSALWKRLLGTRANRGAQVAFFATAVVVGFLPLVHMHSSLCFWGLFTVLVASRPARWRALVPFAVVALATSVAIWVLHLGQGVSTARFLSWHPGYLAEGRGFVAWLTMWARIWGPYLLVALVGGVLVVRRPRHFADRPLVLGGWGLFVLANFVQFQPVAWDNSKMFVWSYLALLPSVLAALERAWRRVPLRGAVIAGVTAMSLTGLLDVTAYIRSALSGGVQMWGSEALEVAERVRHETPPGAAFATAPTHNHPVMALSGRPILVAFTPWVANFGVDPEPRVKAARAIFAGGPGAVAAARTWSVAYVYLGPDERREFFANGAGEAALDATFPLLFAQGAVKVYRVASEGPAGEPP